MKTLIYPLLILNVLCLSSCSTNLPKKVKAAKQHLAANNTIACIDTLSLALPQWKERDGLELRAEGYQLLGTAYHRLGQLDKAVESYRIAVKSSSSTYDSAAALGLILLTSHQYQKSAAAYRDALKMKPNDPTALIGLGNAYFGMAEYAQAKQQYQRVIESAPGVQDALQFIQLTDQKLSSKKRTHSSKSPRRKRR